MKLNQDLYLKGINRYINTISNNDDKEIVKDLIGYVN